MTSWATRLVSLATALAVSGSPAALSACMALCLQAGPLAAMPMNHGPVAEHGSDAPAPAATSDHAHHAATASDATASEHASSPASSNARLVAPCGDCCPDGRGAVIARVIVERTDAQTFAAAPLAAPMASYVMTTVVGGASPPRSPVPPPLPTRAPLVLRI